MVKAVIFDCFGVLAIDGWLKFCDENITDEVRRNKASKLNQLCDKGQMDYEAFLVEMEKMTGIGTDEINARIYERLPKNDQLLGYIKQLKPKYKTATLSNISNPDWFGHYFTKEELELFDDFIISREEGIIKPDPEIFKIAARRLDVALNECVFIDDRPNNVKAAEAVGMRGLLYEKFPQFRKDLENLLR